MAFSQMDEHTTVEMLQGLQRRRVLKRAAATAIGAAAVSAASTAGLVASSTPAQAQTATDLAVLNFALNLEYLEAEYYLHAVTGTGLSSSLTSGLLNSGATGAGGTVTAPKGTAALVPWTSTAVAYWAQQIAVDELNHVTFLRSALGAAAVAEPAIDIQNSFNTLAQAAGLGSTFNPYASEVGFLVGAYIFEDVGVTAYAGAAASLSTTYLPYAASILAVEAYHAGAIRARLSEIGGGTVTDQISTLRYKLSGVGDLGVLNPGNPFTFVNNDANSLAQRRTTSQVLSIVYGGGNGYGLFYPNGMNGSVR
jgi:hypothetical protein